MSIRRNALIFVAALSLGTAPFALAGTFAGAESVPSAFCSFAMPLGGWIYNSNGTTSNGLLSSVWTCPVVSHAASSGTGNAWSFADSTGVYFDYTFSTATKNGTAIGRLCDESFSTATTVCSYNAISSTGGNHDEWVPGFSTIGSGATLSPWDYYSIIFMEQPISGTINVVANNPPTFTGAGIF